VLKFIVDEMICSTNMAFGMYPGLTHGAISALHSHGTPDLQATYLHKLISGEWTGTMCLTEPQCGTDLGMIRTRATPADDGAYSIEGTKIWITGGEHDLVDNIVHLVLAKLPGAPDTTKGISLFIVPKYLPDSGERNSVFCGGLEHKMGIKGSATCVMNFENATGWLVGEPNDGMRAMFTMMNEARLMVGMQGLGLAEMAYQESLAFARERLQGRSLAGPTNVDGPADAAFAAPLRNNIQALQEATMWIAENAPEDPEQAGAAATPYLRLMALTVIAYLWSRMATVGARQLEAGEGSSDLLQSKLVSAQYYFEKLLPESDWLLRDIQSGKDSMMALSDEQWTA
jgi:alkylation response protein AidB-like acyl-CoA dehydrogenase